MWNGTRPHGLDFISFTSQAIAKTRFKNVSWASLQHPPIFVAILRAQTPRDNEWVHLPFLFHIQSMIRAIYRGFEPQDNGFDAPWSKTSWWTECVAKTRDQWKRTSQKRGKTTQKRFLVRIGPYVFQHSKLANNWKQDLLWWCCTSVGR